MQKKMSVFGIASLALSYGCYNLYRLSPNDYETAKHLWTIGLFIIIIFYVFTTFLLIEKKNKIIKRIWLCLLIFQILSTIDYILIHFLLHESGLALFMAWGKYCGKAASYRLNIVYGVLSSIFIPALLIVFFLMLKTNKEIKKMSKTECSDQSNWKDWATKIFFGAILLFIAGNITALNLKAAVTNTTLVNFEKILINHSNEITNLTKLYHEQDKDVSLIKQEIGLR